MKKQVFFVAISFSIILASCTFEKVVPLPEGCNETVFYLKDVKPIIEAKCVTCHSSVPTYLNAADFTNYSIIKEKIDDGSFKNRVFNLKDMAPSGSNQLTEMELAKLRCWLGQGAHNN